MRSQKARDSWAVVRSSRDAWSRPRAALRGAGRRSATTLPELNVRARFSPGHRWLHGRKSAFELIPLAPGFSPVGWRVGEG